MSILLRGMGTDQSLVSRGFINAFFYPPFKEIFRIVSKISLSMRGNSKLWKS